MKRTVETARGRAFSLVEVTLALGVAAFGLVTLLALLPVGLHSNQSSAGQTAANEIISAVVADLRATPPTSPPGQQGTTQRYRIVIPANPVTNPPASVTIYFSDPDQSSAALATDSRYRLTLTFLSNTLAGSPASQNEATMGLLDVYWPAAAPATVAASHVQFFFALDRN